MKIIDEQLLNEVGAQAKESPRLRMNYNFHQSLDEKCHRFLNAVEPGTVVDIHRHPAKDETFVILRGKVRVTTHRDDGSIIEDVVLCAEDGRYGKRYSNVVQFRFLRKEAADARRNGRTGTALSSYDRRTLR